MTDKNTINNDANLISGYAFGCAHNKELFIASIRVALKETKIYNNYVKLEARVKQLEQALAYCEQNQLSDIMRRFDELENKLK